MSMKDNPLFIKIVITAVTIFYGIVPAIADLNETHLFSPGWSPHARFHGAWFLAFSAGIAGVALFLTWLRGELIVPIVIGLMFVSGFWAAALLSSLYGGALIDPNGYEQRILGVESNVFLFSVITLILLCTLIAAVLWGPKR
ncbi:MAG: DUF6640 family protein [Pseudomonadota bacterium]